MDEDLEDLDSELLRELDDIEAALLQELILDELVHEGEMIGDYT